MVRRVHGFSIAEVLTVVAIIGILVVVSTYGLQNSRTNSRDTARVTDLKLLSVALDLYHSECRQYPATLATSTANGCPSDVAFGDFISSIPQDPLGASYDYATSGAGNNYDAYVLRATLESAHSELGFDLDGAAYKGVNLDCDDGSLYYCIGS